MIAVLRRISDEESAQSAAMGWSCVNCRDAATYVISPGGYRLCDEHARKTYAGHVANGLEIERR